ncbi:hypothetical protein HMPREF9629_02241 [Peptoanaerobacter stomatis]|uniref:Uncharacterized protein n=1 Tax=Peptoanaerobacter stomatis TaxID=796937 RepID=G9X1K6_9FIRM|nr:hypothetical protein [Peptoanaerobacter stomatis]EHL13897.1 hypothetical protein HMPREF9629_02241 [Peptoanaerobacter stomatis]
MNKQNYEKILKDIFKIYTQLLPAKDIFFNKKSFKYSSEDIESTLKYFTAPKEVKARTKNAKKSILENIYTKEEAKKHYFENMIYDKSNIDAKNALMKIYSAEDLKKLYKLLYNTKPFTTKEMNFDAIQRFFENSARAKNL